MPFTLKDRSRLRRSAGGRRGRRDAPGRVREGRGEGLRAGGSRRPTPALAPAPPDSHALLRNRDPGEARSSGLTRSARAGRDRPRLHHDDAGGPTLRLSDLRGKVVVLTFIYTRCPLPDFCPLMDRKFAELAGGDRGGPRAGRTGPAALGQLRPRARHARGAPETCPDPGGSAAALDLRGRRARRARQGRPGAGPDLRPDRDEIIHNLSTAVIDPEGTARHRLVVGHRGESTGQPAELLKAIVSACIGHPADEASPNSRSMRAHRVLSSFRAGPAVPAPCSARACSDGGGPRCRGTA